MYNKYAYDYNQNITARLKTCYLVSNQMELSATYILIIATSDGSITGAHILITCIQLL